MSERLCERCWDWVKGFHHCVKRPRPEVLPSKPGSAIKAKPVEEKEVVPKVAKKKEVKTSPVLMRSLEILMSEKPSAPITKTARDRKAKKVETVAEEPAQPELKSGPICQPEKPTTEAAPGSRSKKWRAENREKSRAYMQKYMKDRRALSAEERDRSRYEALRGRFEGK